VRILTNLGHALDDEGAQFCHKPLHCLQDRVLPRSLIVGEKSPQEHRLNRGQPCRERDPGQNHQCNGVAKPPKVARVTVLFHSKPPPRRRLVKNGTNTLLIVVW